EFACNDVVGQPDGPTCNPDDVCESVTVLSGTATIHHNRMQLCKLGLRVQGRGQIDASDNVIKDAYVSAFNMSCLDQTPTNAGKCFRCQGGSADGNGCTPPGNCPNGSCVAAQARLRGQNNWMKNFAFQTSTTSCPRGALVFRSNGGGSPPGIVDFGGG